LKAAELFFEDTGGERDSVVLAHAIGCDHRMWDDLTARLAPDFRVIRFDARGHGRSPVPERPYSLEALADDALAVLDRLGVARAHWVGLSMGAMTGIAFALEHAARLGRLVLANSTSSYGPEGRAMWEARANAVQAGGLAAIRDMVMSRYFSEDFRERQPAAVAAVSERFLATPVEGYLGCCDAIAELDYTLDLPRIHARTLVIAGALDAGTPPAMSQAIAERIPGAQLAVIPGAAHLSAVEKPAEFAALVRGFLLAP
jgi:3-oxoadipate enol-lactonase